MKHALKGQNLQGQLLHKENSRLEDNLDYLNHCVAAIANHNGANQDQLEDCRKAVAEYTEATAKTLNEMRGMVHLFYRATSNQCKWSPP